MFMFFILVYTPKLPIESLEELAESKVYLPLIEAGTVPHTLFRVNTLSIYFAIQACVCL